jgi:hypothetical protein
LDEGSDASLWSYDELIRAIQREILQGRQGQLVVAEVGLDGAFGERVEVKLYGKNLQAAGEV